MTTLDAAQVVGTGFPPDEGVQLARKLLSLRNEQWDQLVVDLRSLPPAMIISPFFNALLQTIYDHEPEWLEQARRIEWRPAFGFQKENIVRWLNGFDPVRNSNP